MLTLSHAQVVRTAHGAVTDELYVESFANGSLDLLQRRILLQSLLVCFLILTTRQVVVETERQVLRCQIKCVHPLSVVLRKEANEHKFPRGALLVPEDYLDDMQPAMSALAIDVDLRHLRSQISHMCILEHKESGERPRHELVLEELHRPQFVVFLWTNGEQHVRSLVFRLAELGRRAVEALMTTSHLFFQLRFSILQVLVYECLLLIKLVQEQLVDVPVLVNHALVVIRCHASLRKGPLTRLIAVATPVDHERRGTRVTQDLARQLHVLRLQLLYWLDLEVPMNVVFWLIYKHLV